MVIVPGHLPGAQRGTPQPEAFLVAVRTPEFTRPRVCLAPGGDDATRLGVLEADPVVQRHALQRADGAAETERQDGHLADAALRLRDRARIFVQDVGGGEGVDIRPRRVAIVGAENIEDFLGACRSGEPGRDPRLDRRPVRPHQHFPRPGNEGGAHEQGKLARRRHVERARRDQRGVAAAVSDRIDERCLRGAVLAEDIAREVLDLRPAAGNAPGLSGAGEAILVAQHAVDLLRSQARELFRRGPGTVKA